jgi:hypothetical protein
MSLAAQAAVSLRLKTEDAFVRKPKDESAGINPDAKAQEAEMLRSDCFIRVRNLLLTHAKVATPGASQAKPKLDALYANRKVRSRS